MSQLHYDENLQPGLFTFYMTQNQEYENYQIMCPTLPLKQSNANYQVYGRKKQENGQSQENGPNQEDRTQKLNKFLSNCVGGRRNKSNQNSHKNGWDPQNQRIIEVKQPHVGRKSKRQSKKWGEMKEVNKLKKEWKIKQIESEIGAKKLLSVNKLNINEDLLERNNRDKKIKIINYQALPLEKEKQNKIHLKLNTKQNTKENTKQNTKQNYKEKERQREERLTEEDLDQIKQYFKNYQEPNASYSGNKVRQLKLLANIYPSLIKHHSQQLLIQPSKNTITVRSLISKNSDNYQPIHKQDNDSQMKCAQKDCRDKNQINILEKMEKKICFTTEKKKSPLCLALPLIESKQKQNRLRIHQSNRLQSKQVNFRISLLSAENNRRMDLETDVGSKYKYHGKRNNRLELAHKNKKNTVNLPPLHLGDGSIEREKQINEIYYSVDHRQKKPLEINVGICPNNRLLEGWEERKKALIQKINENDQKQSKNMNRKKTNTKISIKNLKQNKIEIKSKKK